MTLKQRIKEAAFWELSVCTKCWEVVEEEDEVESTCCGVETINALHLSNFIEVVENEDQD
jgi:hypothetical protein